MVGIASKKENSTIASLLIPMSIPPTIVAPDRDTPGIIANDWTTPVKKDFLQLISLVWVSALFLYQISNTINKTPPKNNAQRTIAAFESKYCFITLDNKNPIMAVGKKAVSTFFHVSLEENNFFQ